MRRCNNRMRQETCKIVSYLNRICMLKCCTNTSGIFYIKLTRYSSNSALSEANSHWRDDWKLVVHSKCACQTRFDKQSNYLRSSPRPIFDLYVVCIRLFLFAAASWLLALAGALIRNLVTVSFISYDATRRQNSGGTDMCLVSSSICLCCACSWALIAISLGLSVLVMQIHLFGRSSWRTWPSPLA
jgi:hypothetical protein